jgi:uncharacterized protein YidB (DUF937 family)
MGFFENLENHAMSGLQGGSNPLVANILQMIQSQPGGLQGLVQSFHDKGLGGLVSSWVGTGQNLPITGDEVHQALGSEKIKELAAAAGISPDVANSTIAQILPGIVDKLTPNGQVPDHGSIMDMASSLLRSFSAAQAS